MKKLFCCVFIVISFIILPTLSQASSENKEYVNDWDILTQYIPLDIGLPEELIIMSTSMSQYENGYIFANLQIDDYINNNKIISSIYLYSFDGKKINELEIENIFILDVNYYNNYIYILVANTELDDFKIYKYNINLEKQNEASIEFEVTEELTNRIINIKTTGTKLTTIKNDKIYIINRDGSGLDIYDLDFNIVGNVTTQQMYNFDEIVEEIPGYVFSLIPCHFEGCDLTGYEEKDNKIVASTFEYGDDNIINYYDKTLETGFSKTYRYDEIISPRMLEDVIVAIGTKDDYYELIILNYEGTITQTIRTSKNLYLETNKNSFVTFSIELDNSLCPNQAEECIKTSFKHYGLGTVVKGKKTDLTTISGNNKDQFYDIANTPDGGYIVVGESSSTDIKNMNNYGGTDAIIIKYDENNNVEWQKNWGGIGDDYFVESIISNQKEIIVVGRSDSDDIKSLTNNGLIDAIIVKYDLKGNIIWQKNFGGNNCDGFSGISPTKDGGFIVSGYSQSTNLQTVDLGTASSTAILVKYDKDGNVEWINNYGTNGSSSFSKVIETTDDSYVAVGYHYYTYIDEYDYEDDISDNIIVKFSSNRDILWEKSYDLAYISFGNSFTDIIEMNNGDYIVVGSSQGYTLNRIIYRYDKAGNLMTSISGHEAIYSNNVNNSITKTSDDGFIVSGYIHVQGYSTYGDNYMLISKYDKKNELEWEEVVLGGEFYSIIEKNNNHYIAVGHTGYQQESDFVIYDLKFESDFNVQKKETKYGDYKIDIKNGNGIINLLPEKGYILDTLTITNSKGEQVDYYEKDGKYYFDLTDAVTVNVTYKEDVINPNTITFLKLGFIAAIIVAIYNLFISKKLKIKKYI